MALTPATKLSRWCAKKAARFSAVAGWDLANRLPGGLLEQSRRAMRVLTYHRFGDHRRDPFCVEAQAFEAQMQNLHERDLAVSLDDVHAHIDGDARAKDGGVLITIDDGCRSVASLAAPILARYRIPSVIYVVAGAIGQGRGPDGEQPEPYMDWDELRELSRQDGVTIGSHAYHHRSLGPLSDEDAEAQGRRSRELLEDKLGIAIESFAYPFGTRADFGPVAQRALQRVGYRSAFTSQHGHLRRGLDPMALPRIKVESGEGLWIFERLCAGGLDSWALADRLLWRMQKPRQVA